MSSPEFDIWLEGSIDQINTVQELLSEPLSDDQGLLVRQLEAIEAWGARMNTMLAYANAFLDSYQAQKLAEIDPKLKVLDRETQLNAMVVNERRYRDILVGLCESIKTRISLGQSILKNATREAVHA